MDSRKDFIDLRDGSTSAGNGPPPMGISMPMPPLPSARKSNAWIVIVVVVSALVLFTMLFVMAVGLLIFNRAVGSAHQVQTVFIEEIPINRNIEVWSRDLGSDITNWVWTPETLEANWDWSWDWDWDWGPSREPLDSFHTLTYFVNSINIFIGVNNVRVLPHENTLLSFNGDNMTFQVYHDVMDGFVMVTGSDAGADGTLTVYVPDTWAGRIEIHTLGDVYLDDNLPSDILINQGLVIFTQ